MNEKISKILGTFLFLVLISGLLYLIFFRIKNTGKQEINMIEVTGNRLLSGSSYLKFTKLNDYSLFKDISLSVIKSRFERHPYIEKADVEYLSGHIARVVVTEKKIEAVLIYKEEPNFLTDEYELLPVLQNTKLTDLPVIINPEMDQPFKLYSKIKNADIDQAFKIIVAAKLASKKIARRLSEINLRGGGEIVLSFSGIKPLVLFGRGETAEKMVYLDAVLDGFTDGNSLAENSDYIDLRFPNEIYIGSADKTGLN